MELSKLLSEIRIYHQVRHLLATYQHLNQYLGNKQYRHVLADYQFVRGFHAFLSSGNVLEFLQGHPVLSLVKNAIDDLDESIQITLARTGADLQGQHYLSLLNDGIDQINKIDNEISIVDCIQLLLKKIFMPPTRIEKSKEDDIEEQLVYLYFQIKVNRLFRGSSDAAVVGAFEMEFYQVRSSYIAYCQSGAAPAGKHYDVFKLRCDYLIEEVEKIIATRKLPKQSEPVYSSSVTNEFFNENTAIKEASDSVIAVVSSYFSYLDSGKVAGFWERMSNLSKLAQEYQVLGGKLKAVHEHAKSEWNLEKNIYIIRSILVQYLSEFLIKLDIYEEESNVQNKYLSEAVNSIVCFCLPFITSDYETIWALLQKARMHACSKRIKETIQQAAIAEKAYAEIDRLRAVASGEAPELLDAETVTRLKHLAWVLGIEPLMLSARIEAKRDTRQYGWLKSAKHYAYLARLSSAALIWQVPDSLFEQGYEGLQAASKKMVAKIKHLRTMKANALQTLATLDKRAATTHIQLLQDELIQVSQSDYDAFVVDTMRVSKDELLLIARAPEKKEKKKKQSKAILKTLRLIENHMQRYFNIDINTWNRHLGDELSYPSMLINLYHYLNVAESVQKSKWRYFYRIPKLFYGFSNQVDTLFYQFQHIETILKTILSNVAVDNYLLYKQAITGAPLQKKSPCPGDLMLYAQIRDYVDAMSALNMSYKGQVSALLNDALMNLLKNLFDYSQSGQSLFTTVVNLKKDVNYLFELEQKVLYPGSRRLTGIICNALSHALSEMMKALDMALLKMGYMRPFLPYKLSKHFKKLHMYRIVAMDNVIIERVVHLLKFADTVTDPSMAIRLEHYLSGLFDEYQIYANYLSDRLSKIVDAKSRNLLLIQERLNDSLLAQQKAMTALPIVSRAATAGPVHVPAAGESVDELIDKLKQRKQYLHIMIRDLKQIISGDMLRGRLKKNRTYLFAAQSRLRLEAGAEMIQKYGQTVGAAAIRRKRQIEILNAYLRDNYECIASGNVQIIKLVNTFLPKLQAQGTILPDRVCSHYDQSNYRLSVQRELFKLLYSYNEQLKCKPTDKDLKYNIDALNSALTRIHNKASIDTVLDDLYPLLNKPKTWYGLARSEGQQCIKQLRALKI